MRRRSSSPGGRGALVLAIILVIIAMGLSWLSPVRPAVAPKSAAVLERAQELLRLRTRLLFAGDAAELVPFYDTGTIGGAWALEKEQARIAYAREWAKERQVEITRAEVEFTRSSVEEAGENAGVSICAHTRFTYRHLDRPGAGEETMGWRTVHWIELGKAADEWLVRSEWYLDPLEAASRNPEVAASTATLKAVAAKDPGADTAATGSDSSYRRQDAVRYADRYAGVKIGPDAGRYNQKYRDFAGVGGDCANFVSQAMTDKEGGGLPTDWGWFYAGGEGTEAWLKAEALVYHLLDSGRAVCLASGSLAEVTAPSDEHPQGALRSLRPGDVIGYEEDGEIVHVSLVVGQDNAGYVLVNSHSADRYHVPWDFGYNTDIKYWLLSVQG